MNETRQAQRGRQTRKRIIWFLLLVPLGCDSSQGTVSGKVLYRGKPLSGGVVTFVSEKGGGSASIQPDGSYRITKLPLGPVKIAVVVPKPLRSPGAIDRLKREVIKKRTESPDTDSNNESVEIPKRYNDPDKSGLTYTVTSGRQTHDIELTN